MSNPLISLGQAAQKAAAQLAQASPEQKNAALQAIADSLKAQQQDILAVNARDIEQAANSGMSDAMIDRLRLDEKRLQSIVDSIGMVKLLPDPVGRLLETVMRPNALRIEKVAVPIGVIGIIFESRPNVAVDAAVLCIKSGNAAILRGGSDSWNSVVAFTDIIREVLTKSGLPADAVQNLPSPSRDLVGALLTLDKYVDLIIPRGGKSLIARVRQESRIPVLSQLEGICHTYIDAKADVKKAVAVTVNAKMRRTSICGATECLVLHKDVAKTIGKDLIQALLRSGCEVRVPAELVPIDPALKQINENTDYGFEFLAPIIAVKIVDNVNEAVDFINTHHSQHTDAIITEDKNAAHYFLRHVNSAIAVHNASTQFADGSEFGKGAEIGIATGKLHARGPVGLEELTTHQYRVYGDGQIRP